MKKPRYIIGAAVLAAMLICCKSKEEDSAQKAIDRYVIFVDSVNSAKQDKRMERWDFIEQEHARKKADAAKALLILQGQDLEKEQKRIRESDEKFEGVRVVVAQ